MRTPEERKDANSWEIEVLWVFEAKGCGRGGSKEESVTVCTQGGVLEKLVEDGGFVVKMRMPGGGSWKIGYAWTAGRIRHHW